MVFFALVVAVVRLDMNVGHYLAQLIVQPLLDVTGDIVGLSDAHLAIDLDMDIHHTQAAVAAGAQVVKRR